MSSSSAYLCIDKVMCEGLRIDRDKALDLMCETFTDDQLCHAVTLARAIKPACVPSSQPVVSSQAMRKYIVTCLAQSFRDKHIADIMSMVLGTRVVVTCKHRDTDYGSSPTVTSISLPTATTTTSSGSGEVGQQLYSLTELNDNIDALSWT